MTDALQALGAHVESHQHPATILEQLQTTAVDMVMIGEDISIEKAGRLAEDIRQNEQYHRVLIVYWFAESKAFLMQTMSSQLQALGVDFCHKAVRDPSQLQAVIKKWRG